MRTISLLALALLLTLSARAAEFFPLDDVRPGMKGVGRTVYSGEKIEEFQVEILGVLKNIAPQQSIILARLSGGQLEKTGLMAGMSGSPVYLDGKLAGAVAFAFPFSTEPIAGIRPIAEMVAPEPNSSGAKLRPARPASSLLAAQQLPGNEQPPCTARDIPCTSPADLLASLRQPGRQPEWLLPPAPRAIGRDPQLLPIATPVSMAGFSERTLDLFGPSLERLGLKPMQGIGGQLPSQADADRKPALEPGSMITVGLIRGDLDLSAAGTVTHVDGNRVYAFGHRFLSSGPTELPMMRSAVVTVVPNLSTSFKIAGSGELLGKIMLDRSTGIAGILGEKPRMLPIEIGVRTSQGATYQYRLEMVNDPFLSPFLLQMALFSALDATERVVGASSYRVNGSVEFSNGLPPLSLDNMFSGPSLVAFQLAASTATPLAFLMQSGLDDVSVRDIHLSIESRDEEKSLEIDRVWASQTRLHPGETVRLSAALHGHNGEEVLKNLDYPVPLGMQPGDLYISFSDGASLNAAEWQNLFSSGQARELPELVRAINRLRRNDRLYVKVWRPGRAVRVHTEQLPSPPASVVSVLSLPAAAGGRESQDWQSTLAEFEVDGLSSVVEGNISMKVTVTE